MIAVGDHAPDFSLLDQEGNNHSLAQYKGKKIVLYFYPRDDTPGCTIQAKDFSAHLDQLTCKGAVVLGVSSDSVESHQKFVNKYGLKFTLLSDENKELCNAYGVWQLKKFMGKEFMGIVRSTFIIDEKGRLCYAKYKVNPKKSLAEVLEVI